MEDKSGCNDRFQTKEHTYIKLTDTTFSIQAFDTAVPTDNNTVTG